jgi:galactose-1-phosphate uridylyltransferase
MRDGFLVCRDYFQRMKDIHPALRFSSINWNYMPPAGGGLIHPHVQTVIGENPTRFMSRIAAKARSYKEDAGSNLWRDLIAYERERDERYIASTGAIAWMVSFAPQGMAGEIRFFFDGKRSIFELEDDDFNELLTGFSRIFKYFDEKNFISFNMALFAALEEDDDLWVQGRLMPRFSMLPLGTSDINYFEKLHDEIICPSIPEELCKDLKALFRDCEV